MQFNEKIIAARKDKRMSQETLAEAVGVSRQAVSKWETGEAKPDLDKLIALCNALDLSMEYLCLDKETAPPPAPQKKKLHPAVISAVLLAEAVLFFLLGMGTCYLLFSAQLQNEPIDTQPPTVRQQSIAEIEIVNVNVDAVFTEQNEKRCQISIMTNTMPDGLQAKLLIEEINHPVSQTSTYNCNDDDAYYRGTMPHAKGRYLVTAILTLGSETKQIPLLNLELSESSYSYTTLWR